MALHVRLAAGQVHTLIGQLLHAPCVPLQHPLQREWLDRRVDQGTGVAGGKEIGAALVGEEELRSVEAGCGGKGTAGSRPSIIGEIRRVALVAHDGIVPAGGTAHRGEHQQPLELRQRQRSVSGAIGEHSIRDLTTEREAARATSEDGVQEGELSQVL